MKTLILRILHATLGYERYLRVFSRWKIRTLASDSRKADFLFFNHILAQDATVFVIGACTGITTIPLAKGYPNRTVFAYEPEPLSYKALKSLVEHFRLTNVSTFPVALGNATGSAEFILPIVGGVKKQGIAHIKDPSITRFNEGISESVAIFRLDEREELNKTKPTGIKLVAENFELEILEGAKNVLLSHRPLIYCELWDNEKRQPVLELIASYGYAVFYRKGDLLLPYDPARYSGKNFFFKPVDE